MSSRINLSTSVQLSVKGYPSAFDVVPEYDNVVVSSPGCLTFFDLKGLGKSRQELAVPKPLIESVAVPANVLHYEQPQQIRKIKYRQQSDIFAALRCGIVSLWNPNSALKPVQGFISSQGWITNFDWNQFDFNLIATGCDCGEIRIWDTHSSLTNYVQNISLGGYCDYISWCPSNPKLFCVSNGSRMTVFDTRKLSIDSPYFLLDKVSEETQFCWSSASGAPMLIRSTSNDVVEWHNTATYSLEMETKISNGVTNICGLLAPPYPDERGILCCCANPASELSLWLLPGIQVRDSGVSSASSCATALKVITIVDSIFLHLSMVFHVGRYRHRTHFRHAMGFPGSTGSTFRYWS